MQIQIQNDCFFLLHPDVISDPAHMERFQSAIDFWDLTNRQDWHVCEQMQLGIRSRVMPLVPHPAALAPVEALGVTQDDLHRPGTVVQLGLPPRRIDLLTRITGVEFGDAWERRIDHDIEGRPVAYLGLADLIANKRATGRAQDLVDASLLEVDFDKR